MAIILAAGLCLARLPWPEPHAAHAQRAQSNALIVAKVVRAEPASRVRLPIEFGALDVPAKRCFVRIRGLPPTVAVSDGFSIGAGSWSVPLTALPSLTIIVPAGLQGESNVSISVVTLEGEVLAQADMVLAVAAAASAEPKSEAPRGEPPKSAPLAVPAPQAATRRPTPPVLTPEDRERARALHGKGMEQLERGQIQAARSFFERAANGGFAPAALALAGTYDPAELAARRVVGPSPNVDLARKWYQKAEELGAVEAAERLRRLGAR